MRRISPTLLCVGGRRVVLPPLPDLSTHIPPDCCNYRVMNELLVCMRNYVDVAETRTRAEMITGASYCQSASLTPGRGFGSEFFGRHRARVTTVISKGDL
jgi:hypothetical protein